MKYEVAKTFVYKEKTFRSGDKFELIGNKIVVNGVVHDFPSVTACLNQGWVIPAEKVNVEQLVNPNLRNLALPQNWDSLHWMKRKTWIESCTSLSLLNGLRESESDKMRQYIDERVQQLSGQSDVEPRLDPVVEVKPVEKAVELNKTLGMVKLPENEEVPIMGLTLSF